MTGVSEPTIATSNQGCWIACWSSRNNSSSDYDLYYSTSNNNGASWSTPKLLNSNGASDTGGDGGVDLAFDGQGHWIAVWNSTDTLAGKLPTNPKILYAISNDNGQTWSAPQSIDAEAPTDSTTNTYPHVVCDGVGHWVVAWATNKLGGDTDFLYVVSSTSQIQWGKTYLVNPWALNDTAADSDNGMIQLASDSQGRVMAIWSSAYNLNNQNTNHDLDILAAMWTADVESSPVVINSNSVVDSTYDNQAQAAMGDNGTCIAVWVSVGANALNPDGKDLSTGDNLNHDLFYARSTDNGHTWSQRALLKTDWATDVSDDLAPVIATDGKGKWMVVWRSMDTLNGTIGWDTDILMTVSTDDGLTWSAPKAINSDASTDPGGYGFSQGPNAVDVSPYVQSDGAGHWVVGWTRYDNRVSAWQTFAMVAASSNDGASWTAPTSLQMRNENVMGSLYGPYLDTDRHGRWLAVWYSRANSSSDFDLFYSFSNNNGVTWDAAKMLNSNGATDSGDDANPQIANDGQGHWIVTWNSTDSLGGTKGTDTDILCSVSNDNGLTWSAPSLVNTDGLTDTGYDLYPQLIYDGLGHWVVGWVTNKLGGDNDFYYAMSDVGGTPDWTDPLILNPWAMTENGPAGDSGLHLTTNRSGLWLATISSGYEPNGNNPGLDSDILALCFQNTSGMLGPTVGANPTSLAYRKGTRYQVDVTRHDPPTTQGLTLNNLGLKKLKVTGLRFTGVHAADYSLVSTPTLPLTFSALTSQSLQVKFAPKETGYTLDLDAALEILSNDSTNPLFTIPIVGDAVPVRLGSFGVE